MKYYFLLHLFPSSVQALLVKRSNVHGTLRANVIVLYTKFPFRRLAVLSLLKRLTTRETSVDSTVFRAVGISLRGSLCD